MAEGETERERLRAALESAERLLAEAEELLRRVETELAGRGAPPNDSPSTAGRHAGRQRVRRGDAR